MKTTNMPKVWIVTAHSLLRAWQECPVGLLSTHDAVCVATASGRPTSCAWSGVLLRISLTPDLPNDRRDTLTTLLESALTATVLLNSCGGHHYLRCCNLYHCALIKVIHSKTGRPFPASATDAWHHPACSRPCLGRH